jgi:hypothetical protein
LTRRITRSETSTPAEGVGFGFEEESMVYSKTARIFQSPPLWKKFRPMMMSETTQVIHCGTVKDRVRVSTKRIRRKIAIRIGERSRMMPTPDQMIRVNANSRIVAMLYITPCVETTFKGTESINKCPARL